MSRHPYLRRGVGYARRRDPGRFPPRSRTPEEPSAVTPAEALAAALALAKKEAMPRPAVVASPPQSRLSRVLDAVAMWTGVVLGVTVLLVTFVIVAGLFAWLFISFQH